MATTNEVSELRETEGAERDELAARVASLCDLVDSRTREADTWRSLYMRASGALAKCGA